MRLLVFTWLQDLQVQFSSIAFGEIFQNFHSTWILPGKERKKVGGCKLRQLLCYLQICVFPLCVKADVTKTRNGK